MKNKSIVAPALLLLLLSCNASTTSTTAPAIPQETSAQHSRVARGEAAEQPFDYYLLNLSWSPEFCHSHPNATECAHHSTFVLHGLWPQNNNGTYPENCSNEPSPRNPATYTDIYPDPGLLNHEWHTHGTCSGLSTDAFFTLVRNAFHSVAIPPRSPTSTTRSLCPRARLLTSSPPPTPPSPDQVSFSPAATTISPQSKSVSTRTPNPHHAAPSDPAVPTRSGSLRRESIQESARAVSVGFQAGLL